MWLVQFAAVQQGLSVWKAATAANARVAQGANTSGMGKALHIAFNGGSVLGLCVVGFGLLGLALMFLLFIVVLKDVHAAIPVVAGYSLGCSFIALFARRRRRHLQQKAADVGADLVGKVEAGIPEDDPRNPAVIADNVGDNVGDIAGMGSDLCESYVGALVSAVSLGLVVSIGGKDASLQAAIFPFIIAAVGIIAAIIGQSFIRVRNWNNPQKALSIATYVATAIVLIGAFASSSIIFHTLSPFLAVVSGLIVGVLIGQIAEYYTSDAHHHVKEIAQQSLTGHATNIISGFSIGMKSTMLTVLLLAAGIVFSYLFFGMYGIALGAVGMLSTTGITVSVDAYGPIADNAGGIAEMADLDERVRVITDRLDSVGQHNGSGWQRILHRQCCIYRIGHDRCLCTSSRSGFYFIVGTRGHHRVDDRVDAALSIYCVDHSFGRNCSESYDR